MGYARLVIISYEVWSRWFKLCKMSSEVGKTSPLILNAVEKSRMLT